MEKVSVLAASPLFEMLSDQELQFVAALCAPKTYRAGEVVFQEGELGDTLYVITSGEVEVTRRESSGDEKVVATLGAPEFFGEMSLIDKEYRSATVKARQDTDVLLFTAEQLATLRTKHKDGFGFVVMNIARVLSRRLREANLRLGRGP